MGRAHASQGWQGIPDPMEAMVEQWLIARGIAFTRDHPSRLDFYLPALDLYIEVKRFATPRIADQLGRVPREDVLVIQGIGGFEKLRRLFGDGGEICNQRPVPHLTKLARAFHEEWHPDKLKSWGAEIVAAVLSEPTPG